MDRPEKQKHDRPFNVLLSLDEMAMLDHISNATGNSRGHVIRNLIRHAFDMGFNHKPKCANGTPCLVPQVHAAPAATSPGGIAK